MEYSFESLSLKAARGNMSDANQYCVRVVYNSRLHINVHVHINVLLTLVFCKWINLKKPTCLKNLRVLIIKFKLTKNNKLHIEEIKLKALELQQNLL